MNIRQSFEGPFRRFGVVYRDETPEVLSIIERLRIWSDSEGIELVLEGDAGQDGHRQLEVTTDAFDLLVALGGDGTFLRASRLAVGTETPVLGINLGRLGFLTAVPLESLEEGLAEVIAGKAMIEPRFRLRAVIQARDEGHSDDFFALNDIVVHTTGAARVTPLSLEVSDRDGKMQEVGTFAADGLIISTPTGSTAYSMSAGGPIIVPEVEAIAVTPICPHSLSVRPLVLPSTVTISVRLDSGGDHQVTVDGQVVRRLAPGDRVVVRREAVPLSLIRLPEQSFFDTLRRKLNWANRLPDRA